jgi:hypothetical protein
MAWRRDVWRIIFTLLSGGGGSCKTARDFKVDSENRFGTLTG